MSTAAGLGKLKQAAKDLRAQWEEVRVSWYDQNSRRFEEQHIIPLLSRLRRVEMALTHLAAVLQEVRQDCE
jgi:hypothetical protein